MNKQTINPLWELSFLAYVACVCYLFYPGFMSIDSVNQLIAAKEHIYFDDHPPLMSLMWHYLDGIIEGPALMLVGQVVGYCYGLRLLMAGLKNKFCRNAIWLLLLLPPVLGIVGIIWKDVWMQNFLILGIACALACANKVTWQRVVAFLLMILCLLFATAMRHNGIAAVASIAFLGVYLSLDYFTRWWQRQGLAFALSAVLCLIILWGNGAINQHLVTEQMHFSQVTMEFDIVGTSYFEKEFLFSDKYKELVVDGADLNSINLRYSSRYHKCLYRSCFDRPAMLNRTNDPHDLELLKHNWIGVIVRHPWAYLKHRYYVSREILNLSGKGLWAPTLANPMRPNDWGIEYHENSVRKAFHDGFLWLTTTPIYHIVGYFFLSLLGLLVTAVLLFKKYLDIHAAWTVVAIFSSGLLYQLSIFVGATSPDFRYSLWMIFCTVLGYLAIIGLSRRRGVS